MDKVSCLLPHNEAVERCPGGASRTPGSLETERYHTTSLNRFKAHPSDEQRMTNSWLIDEISQVVGLQKGTEVVERFVFLNESTAT